MPPDAAVDYVHQNIFNLGNEHLGAYDAVMALEV
jgi:hypothetical protein